MRTDIGHFSIEHNEVIYELIPSFKNMRMICDPEQMPSVYAELFGEKLAEHAKKTESVEPSIATIALTESIMLSLICRLKALAAFIVQCCCELDTEQLTGKFDYEQGLWIDGAMESEDLIHIARGLLVHGVTGKVDPDNRAQKGKASKTLDVYKFVDMAIAHFDMPRSEAEQLTKTEFDRLVDAKYPDAKKGGNDAPTASEHDDAMAWLDEVNARRAAKAANNG